MVQLKMFGDKAKTVKVSSDICEECGSHLLDVTFHQAKTPLDGGDTNKKACLACDSVFNSLTESGVSKLSFRRKGKGKGKKGGRGKGGPKGRSADDEAEERGRKLASGKKRN